MATTDATIAPETVSTETVSTEERRNKGGERPRHGDASRGRTVAAEVTDEDVATYEHLGTLASVRDKLRWIDADEHCRLLHYDTAQYDAMAASEQKTAALLRRVRGWIFDTATKACLSAGCGCPTEWEEMSEQHDSDEIVDDSWRVYESVEGTMLRVHYSSDRWHVSTNRKLNAYQSRWSSPRTFGEQMEAVLRHLVPVEEEATPQSMHTMSSFLASLDPSQVYSFLLRNEESNRIQCTVPETWADKLVYVGRHPLGAPPAFDTWTFAEDDSERGAHVLLSQLPTLCRVDVTGTWRDVHALANTLSPTDAQGILCLHVPSGRAVKVFSDAYREAVRIRGVHPNIRVRYLEVRGDAALREALRQHFPFYQSTFDEVERALHHAALHLQGAYVTRYIRNDRSVMLPRDEFVFLKRVHEHYLQDRDNNRVYPQTIRNMLDALPPAQLHRVLKSVQEHLRPADPRSADPRSADLREREHRRYRPRHYRDEAPREHHRYGPRREVMARDFLPRSLDPPPSVVTWASVVRPTADALRT